MDSRAKQRLTGAVILVALFVLLVPELLKGPRNADAPGTAAEDGMRRYTIDLSAANPATPVESQTEQPVALPQPASPNPADPMPSNPIPSSPIPSNDRPLAKPGDSAEPAAAAAPAPSAAPPVATVTPSAVTKAPPPAPVPIPRDVAQKPAPATPVEPGSFVVQLGSFASRDNANRLVRDMTAKGFAAFVAPIKSGERELYRVRVGPTRDRAQAEALAAQLRRVGQSGSIVPIS
jgi:DedD protein